MILVQGHTTSVIRTTQAEGQGWPGRSHDQLSTGGIMVCIWEPNPLEMLRSQSPSAGYTGLPGLLGSRPHTRTCSRVSSEAHSPCPPPGRTAPQAGYCSAPGRGLLAAVAKPWERRKAGGGEGSRETAMDDMSLSTLTREEFALMLK